MIAGFRSSSKAAAGLAGQPIGSWVPATASSRRLDSLMTGLRRQNPAHVFYLAVAQLALSDPE
jgi:hypothetical protein